jgi:hypothetical protein
MLNSERRKKFLFFVRTVVTILQIWFHLEILTDDYEMQVFPNKKAIYSSF